MTVPRMRPVVDCAATGFTTLSEKTIDKNPTVALRTSAGTIILINREDIVVPPILLVRQPYHLLGRGVKKICDSYHWIFGTRGARSLGECHRWPAPTLFAFNYLLMLSSNW